MLVTRYGSSLQVRGAHQHVPSVHCAAMPVIGVLTGGSAGKLANQDHYKNKIRKQMSLQFLRRFWLRSTPMVWRCGVRCVRPACHVPQLSSSPGAGNTSRGHAVTLVTLPAHSVMKLEAVSSVAKHPQLIVTFCASEVLPDVAEKYLSRQK